MAGAHDEAVRKWGSAAVADLFSVTGLAASLGMVQWTGTGLAFSLEAAIEISEITAIGAFGIVGGGLALAALPVVALGMAVALATHDEKTARDLVAAADALDYASAGTLFSVAVSAPFMAFPSQGGGSDPFLVARVAGPLLDLGAGIFDPDASRLERALAGLASVPGAPGWYGNAGNLYSQAFPSPPQSSPASGSGSNPSAPGPPGSGAIAPGMPSSSPSPFGYGPGPGTDDFYPLMPGMGEFGTGSSGPSGASGSSGDPYTMVMTVNVPGGTDNGADGSNSGSDINQVPTDCSDDCAPPQPTPAPTPPSDCEHDCVHDCSDCSDCDDCEC